MAPAGLDPAIYAAALADVRALRPYGTQPAGDQPAPPPPPPVRDDCGTRRGYRLHLVHGETTCQRCRGAEAARHRAQRAGRTGAR